MDVHAVSLPTPLRDSLATAPSDRLRRVIVKGREVAYRGDPAAQKLFLSFPLQKMTATQGEECELKTKSDGEREIFFFFADGVKERRDTTALRALPHTVVVMIMIVTPQRVPCRDVTDTKGEAAQRERKGDGGGQ